MSRKEVPRAGLLKAALAGGAVGGRIQPLIASGGTAYRQDSALTAFGLRRTEPDDTQVDFSLNRISGAPEPMPQLARQPLT